VGLLYAKDILADASKVLLDPIVNTTLSGSVTAPFTIFRSTIFTDTDSCYIGAMLIVDFGNLNQEIVMLTPPLLAFPNDPFSVGFAKTHAAGAPVYAPTFPTGQTDHPLYTQSEMLQYLADAQNDFLLQTRMIYAEAIINASIGTRAYAQPSDAIRVERVEANGEELFATATADLDMEDPGWQADTGGALSHYFLDELNTGQFGVKPLPSQPTPMTLWYSQRAPATMQLTDSFLVPDSFTRYLRCGVLWRAFSKDGEQRDPLRSEFYKKRYEFGVVLAQRFMERMDIQDPKQTLNVATYERFPIYRSLYGS
jgi:hypothetical protein